MNSPLFYLFLLLPLWSSWTLPHLCVCTHVCVHMCTCASVYVCQIVCVVYTCAHVCMVDVLLYHFLLYLETGSLLNLELVIFLFVYFDFFLARLVNKPQKSCLYVGRHGHAWLFTGVLEIGIQFLMLTQQVSLPTEPSLQNLMSIWQNTYKPPWRGTSIFSLIFISVQNHFMLQLHKKSPKRAVNRKS